MKKINYSIKGLISVCLLIIFMLLVIGAKAQRTYNLYLDSANATYVFDSTPVQLRIPVTIETSGGNFDLGGDQQSSTILVSYTNHSDVVDQDGEAKLIRFDAALDANYSTSLSTGSGTGLVSMSFSSAIGQYASFKVKPQAAYLGYLVFEVQGGTSEMNLNLLNSTIYNDNNQEQTRGSSQSETFVLPIELRTFSAREFTNNAVELIWETGSEVQIHGYEIEKSTDGHSFSAVGFVEGNGTSTNVNQYSFIDPSADASDVFYRLKQVHLDGHSEFSKAIRFNQGQLSMNDVQIYPNPANGSVTIQSKNTGGIEIFDLNGSLVKVLQRSDLQHNVRLSEGNYLVRNAGAKSKGKLLIVH